MTKTSSHFAAAFAALLLTVVTFSQTVSVPAPASAVSATQLA